MMLKKAAMETTGWPKHCIWSGNNKENLFCSLFGCSSKIVAPLWKIILDINDDNEPSIKDMGITHKHLLYALVFLKVYRPNEMVHFALVCFPEEKIFCNFSCYFVNKIAWLQNDTIELVNCFEGQEDLESIRNNCMMSIDCLDCMRYEPGGYFGTQMYLKKHNSPRIKYEVSICIRTAYIVWINGLFKAGEMDDLQSLNQC